MKWLQIGYYDLLILPSVYVTEVIPELINKENADAENARNK